MARCFYITITRDSEPGLYSVYYGSRPFSNYAKFINSQNNAVNIPYNDFFVGFGVGVCVPDDVQDVYLYNQRTGCYTKNEAPLCNNFDSVCYSYKATNIPFAQACSVQYYNRKGQIETLDIPIEDIINNLDFNICVSNTIGTGIIRDTCGFVALNPISGCHCTNCSCLGDGPDEEILNAEVNEICSCECYTYSVTSGPYIEADAEKNYYGYVCCNSDEEIIEILPPSSSIVVCAKNEKIFWNEQISVEKLYCCVADVYECAEQPRPTRTITPTVTPTISITPTISLSKSITPSISITPTNTISVTTTLSATPTSTITPSVTPSMSVTRTPTPTVGVSQTPTISVTSSETPTPSESVTPTPTPSKSITPTPTPIVTKTPTPTVSTSKYVVPELCLTCPTNYEWRIYNNECCYRIEEVLPIDPTNQYNVKSVPSTDYSISGTRIYDFNYNLDGTGNILDTLNTFNIWSNPTRKDDVGPLNRCAVWTDQFNPNNYDFLPKNTWIGFSSCLSTLESRTYWVGIAGDNNFKLILDGEEIINTRSGYAPYNGKEIAFAYWHVYPIKIGAGNHILELYGYNNESIAGFGCEIYAATLGELINATALVDLKIIFSTKYAKKFELIQSTSGAYQPSGYVCPLGYNYSSCNGLCQKIIVCCPEPTPSVTPTISISVTPSISITPTITITPTISITPSITPTISVTPTILVSNSVTPTVSFTSTPTISITPTISVTPTRTNTPTISITRTPSPTRTSSVTPTPTITATITPSPTKISFNRVANFKLFKQICQVIPTPTITPTISVTPSVTPGVCLFNGDFVLLFDESSSILLGFFAEMMASAENLVDRFGPYMANSYTSQNGLLIGLTSFSDSSEIILNLNRFKSTIINNIRGNTRAGGLTFLDLGLQESVSVLTGLNNRPLPKKILVYTDGGPTDKDRASKKATEIKTSVYNGQRIEILAIGINILPNDQDYLRTEIVSKNNFYFNSDSFNIIQLNSAIALALCELSTPIESVVVTVDGPETNIETTCLLTPFGVKYCLSPIILKPGLAIYDDPGLTTRSYVSNPGGYSLLTYDDIKYAITFDDEGLVDTIVECGPSITPSVTPSTGLPPTTTPSVTPSIGETPTPTPTIAETPTPTVTTGLPPTVTPTITITRTPTKTPTPTISVTKTITPTTTISKTITPTQTLSITITPTITVSVTPSNTVGISQTPTITPTKTPQSIPLGYNCPCTSLVPGGTFATLELCLTVCFPSPTPTNTPEVTPSNTPEVTPSNTPEVTPSNTPSNTPTPSCVCWSFQNTGGTTGNVSFNDCNSGLTNTNVDIGETIYKCVTYGTTPSLNSGLVDITPLGTACINQSECGPGGGGGLY